MDNNQNIIEATSLEEAFDQLDIRLQGIQDRISRHDEFQHHLRPDSPSSEVVRTSKTQKQSEQMAENPIYLVEIRDYLAEVVVVIQELKTVVDRERTELEKITNSYKATQSVTGCFSALEKLELPDLEKQLNELRRLDPKNTLLADFQYDLQALKELKSQLADEKWLRIRELGEAARSDSQAPKKWEQLMDLIGDHTDISIFSQWYQLGRLHLLQSASDSLVNWERLHALKAAIQEAFSLASKAEYARYEEQYWEVLLKLEKGFDGKSIPSLGVEDDDGFTEQWRIALEDITNRIVRIEKKQGNLSKKRRAEWEQYLDARRTYLQNTIENQ